ncbi:MAG: protein phosphatase 2C domain-containing protein [Gemmatimonadota bacterium]|jgi:protein phosphatase|nr:protein phosphatase 2C domain-containing protein [Gemmatimonadota bacterium]
MEIAGFSEQGPRPENQDAFFIEHFHRDSLLALADGMGGQKSGRLAADTALTALQRLTPIRTQEEARRAAREANEEVEEAAAADPARHGGMGCALGFLSFVDGADGPGWIAGHVGDVRIFSRSPDGVLRLETRDHTPAFSRWEAGEISLDQIPESEGANRLWRAVGRGGEADVSWLPAAPGWSWLIVSDGIYKALRMDELNTALSAADPRSACEEIRKKVMERGADDNFTAVVARTASQTFPSTAATGTRGGTTSLLKRIGVALVLLLGGMALATLGNLTPAGSELVRLRAEVDSLRAVAAGLTRPIDPFGPSLPGASTDTPDPAPVDPGANSRTRP